MLTDKLKENTAMPLLNSDFEPGTARLCAESFENEDVRNVAKAEYYYFCGQAEKAANLAERYVDSPDILLKLSALLIFTYANLPLGRIHKAEYGMERMKEIVGQILRKDSTPQLQAIGVFYATTVYTLLHLPTEGLPSLLDYIRYLPGGMQMYACYVLAHRTYLEGDYSKALGIAETGLAIQKEICPIPAIYLQIIMAVSLMGLKRTEEAKIQLMKVWETARKDDLIEAFGEHHGILHGLIESCLKKQYPKDYERIIAITYRFSEGWRKIHNPIMKGNVADNLTTTEFSIAMLANRSWTNVEIAEHLNLSEHTIKRYMSDIYLKLGISSRRQLHQFMLQ